MTVTIEINQSPSGPTYFVQARCEVEGKLYESCRFETQRPDYTAEVATRDLMTLFKAKKIRLA